jgi:aquaporin Z
MRKGMAKEEAVAFWIAQFAGGLLAAALLKLMTSGFGDVTDQTGSLGTNNWGVTINGPGAFLLEILVTFLLVFVVLLVTGRAAAPGFAGLAIGLALLVTNLVAIPLDGASVNPARSLGPAIFNGGEPLKHVWLFIIAPLIGGGLAALVAPLMETVPLGGQRAPDAIDPTGADVPGG